MRCAVIFSRLSLQCLIENGLVIVKGTSDGVDGRTQAQDAASQKIEKGIYGRPCP